MIKAIASTVILTLFITALAVPIGAFIGIVDYNDFAPFISLTADIVEPFITQFDTLFTTFPYMLSFILYFSILGIIRLVVVQFEKK